MLQARIIPNHVSTQPLARIRLRQLPLVVDMAQLTNLRLTLPHTLPQPWYFLNRCFIRRLRTLITLRFMMRTTSFSTKRAIRLAPRLLLRRRECSFLKQCRIHPLQSLRACSILNPCQIQSTMECRPFYHRSSLPPRQIEDASINVLSAYPSFSPFVNL